MFKCTRRSILAALAGLLFGKSSKAEPIRKSTKTGPAELQRNADLLNRTQWFELEQIWEPLHDCRYFIGKPDPALNISQHIRFNEYGLSRIFRGSHGGVTAYGTIANLYAIGVRRVYGPVPAPDWIRGTGSRSAAQE